MENENTFNVELFKKIFIEFKNTDNEIIDYYSSLLWDRFSCFLMQRKDVRHLWFLLVAHNLRLKETGGVGVVTSASQGSVSTSIDIANMGRDGYWLQTPYGSELYNIIFNRVTFRVF